MFKKIMLLTFAAMLVTGAISFPKKAYAKLNETGIVIFGKIDEALIMDVQHAIDKAGGRPLHIYISSNGGYVDAGNAIIGLLNYYKLTYKTTVSCTVPDKAYSMAAGIVLEACDHVKLESNARLMYHSAKICPGLFEDCYAWYDIDLTKPQFKAPIWKEIRDELYRFDFGLATKLAAKAGLTVNEALDKLKAEWWVSKEEACKVRLADTDC